MLVGHYALALAAKKAAPKTSLGMLIAASAFVDLIWPLFRGLADVQPTTAMPHEYNRLRRLIDEIAEGVRPALERNVGQWGVIATHSGQVVRDDLMAGLLQQRDDLIPAPSAMQ